MMMSAAVVIAGMALVFTGAAIQVAVGAGLSVVCGPFILVWLGAKAGVPVLLCLNLLVSMAATVFGIEGVRWNDVLLASGATLVGIAAAFALPPLPDAVVKGVMSGVLVVVAVLPPPAPGVLFSEFYTRASIVLAGLVTGALTAWTASPGPVMPLAMARGGRSGDVIRKTMQPVSIVGYGAALVWTGAPDLLGVGAGTFAGLVAATLIGTGAGFIMRRKVNAAHVVLLIRIIAGAAALLLLLSLFR
jgi:hypothetical protein